MLAKLKAFAQARQQAEAAKTTAAPAAPAVKVKLPLMEVLVKHLSQPRPPRSVLVTHASDLTKESWCPRAAALHEASNTEPKAQYHPVGLKVTFENGDLLAEQLRAKWMGQRALGKWRCIKCNAHHTGRKPDFNSPLCLHLWRYEELVFEWPEYEFTGAIDLFADLDHPEGKATVVEIKTMNPEDFKSLKAPLAEHRIRTALYLALLERNKASLPFPVDTQTGIVLYISRGYGTTNPDYHNDIIPFREFTVDNRPEDIKDPLDRALVMKKFKAEKKLPEKTCKESWTEPAKWCSAVAQCFSGKYH